MQHIKAMNEKNLSVKSQDLGYSRDFYNTPAALKENNMDGSRQALSHKHSMESA